jgi:hypothetical protein
MATADGRQYSGAMNQSRFATLLLTAMAGLSALTFVRAAAPLAPAVPAADAAAAEGVRWTEIKDLKHDARDDFFAGFKRLETRLDEQISELTTQRAAKKGDASTKDWDFAMKEVGHARSYLRGAREVLEKANADTWAQEKEKLGLAWVRAQAAVSKVRGSSTR